MPCHKPIKGLEVVIPEGLVAEVTMGDDDVRRNHASISERGPVEGIYYRIAVYAEIGDRAGRGISTEEREKSRQSEPAMITNVRVQDEIGTLATPIRRIQSNESIYVSSVRLSSV